MSTLQLTREAHYALERVLKRAIDENKELIRKCPTLKSKVEPETVEYETILQQLLCIPLLSPPRPDPEQKKDNRIPPYARPKFRVAT